jgi:hypothetical protein
MIFLFPVDYKLLFEYAILILTYGKGKTNGKQVSEIFMKIKDSGGNLKLRFLIDWYSKVMEDNIGSYHPPEINSLFKGYSFEKIYSVDDTGKPNPINNNGSPGFPVAPLNSPTAKVFCSCFVLVLFLFSSCFVLVLFLFCSCFILVLFLFCSCFILVLFLFCSCFVLVLFLFCSCFVFVLFLFCSCFVLAWVWI